MYVTFVYTCDYTLQDAHYTDVMSHVLTILFVCKLRVKPAAVSTHQGCAQIESDWTPNGRNLRLFEISISTLWLDEPK